MGYRLLVLDIDGTVTNSRKEVTEETRKAIVRLQEKGVRVAIASGRHPKGVLPIAKILNFHETGNFILAFNGAKIIDVRQNTCVYERGFRLIFPPGCGRMLKNMGWGFQPIRNMR